MPSHEKILTASRCRKHILVAFFSAAREAFCTSRSAFPHLKRMPLRWRVCDIAIAMCRKECIQYLYSFLEYASVQLESLTTVRLFVAYVFFWFQGSMLSAFFWGYTMTQVAGGYLSDRIGGDRVMTVSVVGWSLLTFWTPWLVYIYPDKATLLSFIVFTRVVMGCLQGNSTAIICHFFF